MRLYISSLYLSVPNLAAVKLPHIYVQPNKYDEYYSATYKCSVASQRRTCECLKLPRTWWLAIAVTLPAAH